MFLEKTMLKDVSSNDADWIHDLRIIIIAAQKNYVLDAPLGDRTILLHLAAVELIGDFISLNPGICLKY